MLILVMFNSPNLFVERNLAAAERVEGVDPSTVIPEDLFAVQMGSLAPLDVLTTIYLRTYE